MRRHLNVPILLSTVFSVSLLMLSQPQILYGHSGGGSHQHPHDPDKTVCPLCAELVTPGDHYCPELEKRDKRIKELESA